MTKSELASFIKNAIQEGIAEIRNQLSGITTKEDDYCTIGKAAQLFKVTKATIHNWAKNGSIKKYKLNGRTLLKVAEIESLFIKKN